MTQGCPDDNCRTPQMPLTEDGDATTGVQENIKIHSDMSRANQSCQSNEKQLIHFIGR